jgi:hypothetical protein
MEHHSARVFPAFGGERTDDCRRRAQGDDGRARSARVGLGGLVVPSSRREAAIAIGETRAGRAAAPGQDHRRGGARKRERRGAS